MNARDELFELLDHVAFPETPEERDAACSAIEAMLQPRTITATEELEDLPKQSVVLDAHGEAYQRIDDSGIGGGALWCAGDVVTSSLIDLPATVIHEPRP